MQIFTVKSIDKVCRIQILAVTSIDKVRRMQIFSVKSIAAFTVYDGFYHSLCLFNNTYLKLFVARLAIVFVS